MTERHYRRSAAEVDLRRIRENYRSFCSIQANDAFICPMVKANAYGHGAAAVAKALRTEGVRYLGVALVEEGEELRRCGDRDSILVFGPIDIEGAESVLRENLTAVVSEWGHLEALEYARNNLGENRVGVHAEFNTGMNRLGFEPEDAVKLRDWFASHTAFKLDGICTHLLRGDDAGAKDGESRKQIDVFEKISSVFSNQKGLLRHVLNSSGSIDMHAHGEMASFGSRPGIGLYGYGGKNDSGLNLGLKPALTLRSHLASIHRVEKDARVSYGPTWKAKRPSTIGVLPFGYADGYRRSLSNKAEVLFSGIRVPTVGTICMDYFMIDLTDAEIRRGKPAVVGEEIILIGEQGKECISAADLAEWAGTIPYEILTGISARVPRFYIG